MKQAVIITGLTDLEKVVLNSLASQMYAEEGFSDVGATEISEDTSLSTKVVRGVLSSLVKKGLITIESRDDHWGYKHGDSAWEPIIYLKGDAIGLVKHWVESSDGYTTPAVIA